MEKAEMNESRLKIAVCFFGKASGHQTMYSSKSVNKKVCFMYGINSIKQYVFQHHDIDVYCHTWSESQDVRTKLNILLAPKKIITEKQRVFYKDVRPQAFMSQFYSRSQSIELALAQNKSYDLIVAIRYDLFFFKPVNYNKVKQGILYSDGDVYTRDWHFVGDSNVMNKVSNMLEYAKCQIELGIKLPCQSVIYFPYYDILKLERRELMRYSPEASVYFDTDFCLVRTLKEEKIKSLERKLDSLV